MFKRHFCLFRSCHIALLVSILEGDAVEAVSPATSPAQLYCFTSHILDFNRHWHCKVKKFDTVEGSSFYSCSSTHLLLKQLNENETNIVFCELS